MRRTVAWLVILSLLLPACASRNVPPIGAEGQAFKPESDERALWAKAEKEEEPLLKKAKVYDDPMLDEYLARIGDRLTPDQVREAGGPGFKFGVIRDPTLNAFALPNGHIYVHTGLLSRLDNESQLAMIVGHEMTHVTTATRSRSTAAFRTSKSFTRCPRSPPRSARPPTPCQARSKAASARPPS